jgi:hypothetical protein
MDTIHTLGRIRWSAAAFLGVAIIFTAATPAVASWWGSSVSKMDVRGVRLGMSVEEVAKLHPELQLHTGDTWQIVGGQKITFDPSIVGQGMTDGGACCFSVGFASPKDGGGVDSLYLHQTLPMSTDISDLFADMKKRYGSPTDQQQYGSPVEAGDGSITATWGMSIDASDVETMPQSGQVLRIELDKQNGTPEVSFFLEDFGMQAADARLMRDFMAQVTRQQTDQASKTLNY